ncbi:MAG: hypothetical protein AB7L66_21395 [Gemmatimonadales bacterium]
MNTAAALGFVALTLLWFLLPLIPAVLELVRPTDLTPLSVVPRDAGDVPFLARRFREYLGRQVAGLPADTPTDYLGKLPDGTRFARVTRTAAALAPGGRGHDRVVQYDSATTLPGEQTFLQELHAASPLVAGAGSVYRAVLGEQSVLLGGRSRVLRWIHAAGPLEVGPGSVLQGRASSDRRVVLDAEVTFDRIGAPEITVRGTVDRERSPAPTPVPFAAPESARRVGNVTRIAGDLVIPAGAVVGDNLVVMGSLTVERGASIRGSVKVHGDAGLGADVELRGALVARRSIAADAGCLLAGPVIAESAIVLGPGSVIGTAAAPTTVSAEFVALRPGVTIFGQVTARLGGITKPT